MSLVVMMMAATWAVKTAELWLARPAGIHDSMVFGVCEVEVVIT